MLMNAEQAAKLLKRHPSLLRKWAKDGKVADVFRIGVAWVAKFSAWEAAALEKRKPGRKPKSVLPLE